MRRREAGFTLLEMLVALIVFGLLMAGLSQTMRYGLRSWAAETKGAANAQDLAAVDGAIRRLVEQAVAAAFVGHADRMAFTSTLPEGANRLDRLADAALLVEDGRLVLRWTPHPAGIPLGPPPVPHEELLMDGVRRIDISYLTAGAGQTAWISTWTKPGLPLLVRIAVRFDSGRLWPDLVAAPLQ